MKGKLVHLKEFNNIKDKNIKNILFQFEEIINNIWCVHSENKGFSKMKLLQNDIKEIPVNSWQKINIEMEHVKLRHGLNQARQQFKDEIVFFIKNILIK